jgi:hypothetical protein
LAKKVAKMLGQLASLMGMMVLELVGRAYLHEV